MQNVEHSTPVWHSPATDGFFVDVHCDSAAWWWFTLHGGYLYIIGANSLSNAVECLHEERGIRLDVADVRGPYLSEERATTAGLHGYGQATGDFDLLQERGRRDTCPNVEQECPVCHKQLSPPAACACQGMN